VAGTLSSTEAKVGTKQLIAEGRLAVAEYDKMVGAGKRARKDLNEARWKLGKLALKIAPTLSDGNPHTPTAAAAGVALKEYAQDIGLEYKTLGEYRRVVEAWNQEQAPQLSWETTRTLAAAEDVQEAYSQAKEIASAAGHDEVQRDDARKALGLKEAHGADEGTNGKTAYELLIKASLCADQALRMMKDGSEPLTPEWELVLNDLTNAVAEANAWTNEEKKQ
jgi:hypothetical protein